ncbi:hypothetical protein HIM_02896 [Hirsutella minnesotensis 3608]|nr:hypothetical protein HIM_02896 [Hirsutella minnesotensis 3608]
MRHMFFNFITLHYAYIVFMGLLSLPVLLPQGNIQAVDAYYFGASASTEAGLNTVDLKDLELYQQLYLYFIPLFTNLGFINIVVVAVRLYWFRKRINKLGHAILQARRRISPLQIVPNASDPLSSDSKFDSVAANGNPTLSETEKESHNSGNPNFDGGNLPEKSLGGAWTLRSQEEGNFDTSRLATKYDFEGQPRDPCATVITCPVEAESRAAKPKTLSCVDASCGDQILFENQRQSRFYVKHFLARTVIRLFQFHRPFQQNSIAMEHNTSEFRPANRIYSQQALSLDSYSKLGLLNSKDRDEIGGVEYRSLKLLLKISTLYFFGIHLFGGIGLLGWIHHAEPKYTQYLEEIKQDKSWWAFYTAQSVINNLGFTLTPDNMVRFRDAVWPLLLMSFLGLAGETMYPVFLRLIIWTMSILLPRDSPTQEPLKYLLDHPRRCFLVLFPSGTTRVLCGITLGLIIIDMVLVVVLDLHNAEVASLPIGNRFVAALFQAVASRHAGMTPYNLAKVSPAVQFSLMVMMYIAIYPIAMSIRTSGAYEEKPLGVYTTTVPYDERKGVSYLRRHMQEQLGFDIWYIFLGVFLLSITESAKIQDLTQPSFGIFPILFEVVSAYANVGISLGHPSTAAALSAKFSTGGKSIMCAVMIRGRHRAMPYTLDRDVVLPDEHLLQTSDASSP